MSQRKQERNTFLTLSTQVCWEYSCHSQRYFVLLNSQAEKKSIYSEFWRVTLSKLTAFFNTTGHACWQSGNTVLRRLRQRNCQLKVYLVYIGRPYLKQILKKNPNNNRDSVIKSLRKKTNQRADCGSVRQINGRQFQKA